MALKRAHLGSNTAGYCKVGPWTAEVAIGLDVNKDEDVLPPSEHEYGHKPIWLKLYGPKFVALHLTGFTAEELDAFQEVVTQAIEAARPICQDLDEQALKALLDGEEQVPQRALASAPPKFTRNIDTSYESPGREHSSYESPEREQEAF